MFQDRANNPSPDLYAYKAADESLSSNTTLQNDDHLSVSVKSGRKYAFRLVLHVTYAAAGNGAIKFSFSTSAAATYFYADVIDAWPANITSLTAMTALSDTRTAAGASISSEEIVVEGAYEPSADGTFQLQWAQNSSDADATTVKRGSYLALWRLA